MRLCIAGPAVLALVVAPPAAAQRSSGLSDGIAAVGDSARSAWMARDFASLFVVGSRVQLRVPGVEPSAGVGPTQAVTLLRAYVQGTVEVDVEVVSARAAGTRRAFVDLRRRYRLDGTQEEREESVLLGYRRVGTGWRLVDLRVLPGP
ncbi:MAG: hypothetical protein ACREL2_04950 [Gemmatimonadales bacterium]